MNLRILQALFPLIELHSRSSAINAYFLLESKLKSLLFNIFLKIEYKQPHCWLNYSLTRQKIVILKNYENYCSGGMLIVTRDQFWKSSKEEGDLTNNDTT